MPAAARTPPPDPSVPPAEKPQVELEPGKILVWKKNPTTQQFQWYIEPDLDNMDSQAKRARTIKRKQMLEAAAAGGDGAAAGGEAGAGGAEGGAGVDGEGGSGKQAGKKRKADMDMTKDEQAAELDVLGGLIDEELGANVSEFSVQTGQVQVS
jgi:hypothetical protein